MIKALQRMMLFVLLTIFGSAMANAETTVTWVAAEKGYSNAEVVATATIDENITMVLDQGTNSNSPKYYNAGAALRVYGGGTLSLNGGEGITIKKVVITFGDKDGSNEITTEEGTYADGTWEGESQNVVFAVGGTSGHRRFAAFEVTYDEAPAEPNTATWEAASGDALTTIFVGNDLTLTWAEANGTGAPRYNNGYARLLKENTLTVAGASEAITISKVFITFKSSDDPGLTPNVGSISNDYTNVTTTWTGEANSIKFTAKSARNIESITVTYTGSAAPVEKLPVLTITNDGIADTYDMDANGVFVVYYENSGNAVAENAKLTLYVDGQENNAKEIGNLNFGTSTQNFWNAKYNLEGVEAGEHEVYLKITADNAEAIQTEAKKVTFTKKAPEATFTVGAENVNVEYGAESYQVIAIVANTSEVAAEGVQVMLQRNAQNIAEAQTIDLAAGERKQVIFTVAAPEGGFAAGETSVWVMVKAYEKTAAQQQVTVTFAEQVVPDVKDLAVIAIDGTIDLANETNNVRITVQNNGNVDIKDAVVTLKAGEAVLGTATVSANKGQTGFCYVEIASEGQTAGELAVTAIVEVEEDATPADNTKEATLTVKAIPAPEAAFEVVAEAVTVAYGATSFGIKAVVKNTSEVAAENVEVKLFRNEVIATQTIEALAAGAEQEVTFTIEATDEAPFVAGRTISYYVQAPKTQTEVAVTFEAAPVVPVVDINLIDIRGLENINLQAEQHVVMVTFQNNSNVDVENATITLTMNGTQVGEPQTIAKGEYSKSFTLPTEGLAVGESVELVATLSVEGNKEGNVAQVTKTLPVISGEVEPAPAIAINPISSWEVEEAGEQTINVSVGVFNNGDADADEVTIKVYQTFGTILDSKTIAVEKGESALVGLSFDYDIQGATSFHVVAYINNTPVTETQNFTVSVKQVVPELGLAKIADINATTEEDVKIAAVVKNNSALDASDVQVGVYTQGEDYQYQLVGFLQSIETIAAGETAEVEFNLGKLVAGTYKYYVRIVTTDDNMDNNMQDVTVKVTEPVAPIVNVGLTAIQGISNIDLAAESNAISVWVKNEGNVNIEAALVSVTLNGTELTETVSVNAGQNAYVSFELPTTGLEVGTKATVVASITVEGNAEEAVTTLTREYDVVDSSVATEPIFAVEAAGVEVELGAEKFNVVATIKNTGAVDATSFDVNLFYNAVIATQTIETLAAGEETVVTFADVENPFTKAGTYSMYVLAPKAQAEVTIAVKDPYVEPVYDLAITAIQGSLDLAYENGTISVAVENKGNQDLKDAIVKLTVGETEYEKAVSVKAGETGYAIFTVATEGLTAGTLNVTATVEVEGDETADNTLSQDINVKDIDTAEPTFSVTAEDVTVAYGATSFEIKAIVKNTSEVAAEGLTVKLLQGITEVETKTLNIVLAAGEETEVSFTIEATDEAPFVAGKTATYYVQVANVAQAEVTVTFEEAPVEKIVDLAVTSIGGRLSVEVENNYVTVFVENKGNVDVNNATVTLTAGETELGTATVSAKAGSNGFCSIVVPATALQNETVEITATVEAAGDINAENNSMTKAFEIALPDAQVEIAVADITVGLNWTSFTIPVQVKNLRENFAAKNVKVMIYDSTKLIGQTTIETIAAGAEVTANVNVELEAAYTEPTVLRAWATGYSETQLVEFNLVIDPKVGINDMKEMNQNIAIYTLGGRKVNNMKKAGIYIVNGRKVVVK